MKNLTKTIEQKKREIESLILINKGYLLDNLNYVNEEISKLAIIHSETNMNFIDKSYLTNDFLKEVISHNAMILNYVENPTDELKMIAIKQNGMIIEDLTNLTKEMMLEAVKSNPFSIGFIKEPTEEMMLMAVTKKGECIEYIKNPTRKVQIVALKDNGDAINFIKDETEEMKLLAIESNPLSIRYMRNPSYELQLLAVSKNGFAIEYIENPTEEIKKIALEQNIDSYSVFPCDYRSENLMIFALREKDEDCSNILVQLVNGEWRFSIGCDKNLSKLDMIYEISNYSGGLSEHLYAIEYLKILDELFK